MRNNIYIKFKRLLGIIFVVIGFPFYILDRACTAFIQNGAYAALSFLCGGFVILHFFTGAYEPGISFEAYRNALLDIWRILFHCVGATFVICIFGVGFEILCGFINLICIPGISLYRKGKRLYTYPYNNYKAGRSKIGELSNVQNRPAADVHQTDQTINVNYSIVTKRDIEDSDIINL